MRNVLLFLLRYHVLLLFLLLQSLSFFLLMRSGTYHGSRFFSMSSAITGRAYTLNSDVREYFLLRTVNDRLSEENALLRGRMAESQFMASAFADTVRDTVFVQQYVYVPAKVVNNSVHRQKNMVTLNKGLLHGVGPDMAVISQDGIVGVVKDVSKNFASVLSILHRDLSISARITGSRYFGALAWDGRDPLYVQLRDIPTHVRLEIGQTVETSGHSAMFPEGIPIGKVTEFHQEPGDNFHSITVELNTDPRTWGTVYVVQNLMRGEQLQLEQQTVGHE